MKYCNMPFEYLYLDHYNGDVYLCPWMEPKVTAIGNLLHDDLDAIWHGEKAEALRDTARNGSYAHCRMVACPSLQNRDLPDEPEGTDAWKCADSPKFINLAFDFVCNQSCPTCRNDVFVPDENYQKDVDKIVERILPYINKAEHLSASGHGDPFASPYMMRILENLHPENENFDLRLETNGVFFDEEHWKKIEHLQNCHIELIVTTNSYTPAIYEAISRHGNLEKLKKNELFMRKLRDDGKLNKISNAMVIQERNFHEIPDFIKTSLDTYGFDNVILRPVYNWGNLTEEEYWFKDVLNPLHPYHEQYKKIIEQRRLNKVELRNQCRSFLLDCDGVKDVKTTADVLPPHSGDLIVEIMPGWNLLNEESGEKYQYRANFMPVPIIIYGEGIKPQHIDTEVTIDRLAPTIANCIHIRAPNASTAQPLF